MSRLNLMLGVWIYVLKFALEYHERSNLLVEFDIWYAILRINEYARFGMQ